MRKTHVHYALIFSFLLVIASAQPVIASPPQKFIDANYTSPLRSFANGYRALQEQRYADAADYFRSGVKGDDGPSEFYLATLYARGDGVPQDLAMALELYRTAAGHDLAAAQYQVGLAYEQGGIVPQDYGTAVGWFEKAAAQNLTFAQFKLGVAYHLGRGGRTR